MATAAAAAAAEAAAAAMSRSSSSSSSSSSASSSSSTSSNTSLMDVVAKEEGEQMAAADTAQPGAAVGGASAAAAAAAAMSRSSSSSNSSTSSSSNTHSMDVVAASAKSQKDCALATAATAATRVDSSGSNTSISTSLKKSKRPATAMDDLNAAGAAAAMPSKKGKTADGGAEAPQEKNDGVPLSLAAQVTPGMLWNDLWKLLGSSGGAGWSYRPATQKHTNNPFIFLLPGAKLSKGKHGVDFFYSETEVKEYVNRTLAAKQNAT
jgi:peptidoglycan DL-endopeptidase CwlO